MGISQHFRETVVIKPGSTMPLSPVQTNSFNKVANCSSLITKEVAKGDRSMDRESARANPLIQVEAKRIHINAREFLEAFRDRSDDYYLMRKFSLKPKHLRKIYDRLMERGLLAEYEYNHRDKKSLEVEEKTVSRATLSPVVLTPDSTSEAVGKFTTFPSESHSQPSPAPHVSTGASTVVELRTTELCPRCDRAKHPDYPDSCPYCGVVFAKIKQSEKSEKVAI